MNYYLNGWFCASFMVLMTIHVKAQQSPVTAGNVATGTGGSVSWSLGQVFASAQESNTANLNQGVQQPYEIFVVSSSEEAAHLAVRVFPNPTLHQLTLQLDAQPEAGMYCRLTDLQGRTVYQQEVTAINTDISADALTPGTYLLTIGLETKFLHTFKIIKH